MNYTDEKYKNWEGRRDNFTWNLSGKLQNVILALVLKELTFEGREGNRRAS